MYVLRVVFLFFIVDAANVQVNNCDIGNRVQYFLDSIVFYNNPRNKNNLLDNYVDLNVIKNQEDNINRTETCTMWYKQGVEAYLDERWDECVYNIENAIKLYNEYINARTNCRLKCHIEVEESNPLLSVNVDDMHFYEKMLKKTLCFLKCRNQHTKQMPPAFELSKQAEKIFDSKKPYEYLQICYYHTKKYQKAASAVFTFLVSNPGHTVMLDNLRYYSNMEGVDTKQIINFETEDYVYLYVHGVNAYEKENWEEAVAYMEESLISLIQAEERCRINCEGPFDHGWFPDFTASIANHFTFCLKCKRFCPLKLNTLNGEKHEDLLPSHYHYLQYSYYKLGKLQSACEAVASYLLFLPLDETMISNKDYYLQSPKVQPEYFIPRKEALHYIQRQEYEQALLRYIDNEFVFGKEASTKTETIELDLNKPLFYKTSEILERKQNQDWKEHYSTQFMYQEVSMKKRAVENLRKIGARKLRLLKKEQQLNGTQRFLAEGYATEEECRQMLELAQVAAVTGDGYFGNVSPHTNMESISGLTIGKLSLLVYLGFMYPEYLDTLMRISQVAKDSVERYFNVRQKLYFTFTHLVCRSALFNSYKNRTDLSHAIHADNCNLEDDGECFKQPPAYVWRDYSAIIYLNDDFEGGEFIFSGDKDASVIQSSVNPSCGRLVAFSSGKENLHGVKAVTRGTRCALALWFTKNLEHSETDWNIANVILKQVQQNGNINQNAIDAFGEGV